MFSFILWKNNCKIVAKQGVEALNGKGKYHITMQNQLLEKQERDS
jgi:hypothetical protein